MRLHDTGMPSPSLQVNCLSARTTPEYEHLLLLSPSLLMQRRGKEGLRAVRVRRGAGGGAALGGEHQPSVWSEHPEAQEVLQLLVLPLLEVDALWRAAGVCTVWRAAAAAPALWAEPRLPVDCALSCGRLKVLCVRAGASLRTLRLDSLSLTRRPHLTAVGLLEALRAGRCAGLRHLSLSREQFDMHPGRWKISAEQALRLVRTCPTLEHATCFVRCTSLRDALATIAALPGPLRLQLANTLGKPRLNDAAVSALAATLRTNATLTSLELDGDDFSDTGVAALAEALKVDVTLGSLSLCNGAFGNAGAAALADALLVNKTLTSLSLVNNPEISDEGVAALSATLRRNGTLTSLDLSYNGFSDADIAALAGALRANTALKSLNLSNNPNITDAAKAALAEALPARCVLLAVNDQDDEE